MRYADSCHATKIDPRERPPPRVRARLPTYSLLQSVPNKAARNPSSRVGLRRTLQVGV